MALSKTTSTVLKTGVTIAGTAAAFTPIGGLVGLTGAAAVAADVVGGTVIGGLADKLGKKAKSEINEHTEKSKTDKDKKKTVTSTEKSASSDTSHAKSKSSVLKKTTTVAATGVGALGLTNLLGNNKNGRSTSTTTSKFSTDLKKIQDSSTKNYQKDLARAGITTNTGSAAEQASMS